MLLKYDQEDPIHSHRQHRRERRKQNTRSAGRHRREGEWFPFPENCLMTNQT